MPTTICWDVDTQVDFIMTGGKLVIPGAESIIPALAQLTAWAHASNTRIVATADDHDVGHAEITDTPNMKTTFPPHCMRGTEGQRKIAATALDTPLVIQPVPLDAQDVTASVRGHRGDILLNKPGTDVFKWNPNAARVLQTLSPDRVIIYGVATDICVRLAVEGIARARPSAELVIVTDAVRALSPTGDKKFAAAWAAKGYLLRTAADVTR